MKSPQKPIGVYLSADLMERFTGLIGLTLIVLGAYFFSSDRKAIKPSLVMWGLGLQFGFAFLVLKTNFGMVFQAASVGVNALLEYAEEGSKFLFGPLGSKNGGFGVIFATQVLPKSGSLVWITGPASRMLA